MANESEAAGLGMHADGRLGTTTQAPTWGESSFDVKPSLSPAPMPLLVDGLHNA